MGIISRFFLLLYVLVVGTVSVICAGVYLKVIPKQTWQSYLNYILAQQETIVILAVIFFFSLFFLGYAFSPRNDKRAFGDIILKSGEPGEVRVAIEAIKHITERAALSVNGVREVKVVVFRQKSEIPIALELTIILGQGHSAPVVSEAVTHAVDKAIFTALQLGGVPIDIKVQDITNAVVERKQRVV